MICFFHGVSKSAFAKASVFAKATPDPNGIANGASHRAGVPISKADLRIWSKKVLDSRFPILVTRYEKRGKTFFDFAVFGVQVAALLIEKRIAGSGQGRKISYPNCCLLPLPKVSLTCL